MKFNFVQNAYMDIFFLTESALVYTSNINDNWVLIKLKTK